MCLRMLVALTLHLPDQVLDIVSLNADQVVRYSYRDVSSELEYQDARASALEMLAPQLPENLFGYALDIVNTIWPEWYRSRALAALAPRIPKDLYRRALDIACAIEDDANRARGITALASWLPVELRSKALDEVRKIKDEEDRSKILSALASEIPEDLLSLAFKLTSEIKCETYRRDVLAKLATRLITTEFDQMYQIWLATIQTSTSRTRKDLLSDISAMTPVIATLGGADAIRETHKAVIDIDRWWP
jgi:hypothetical protein